MSDEEPQLEPYLFRRDTTWMDFRLDEGRRAFDKVVNKSVVWVHPDRMGGKPCIRGTRLPVAVILEWLAAGYSVERVLQAYPFLSLEAVEHIQSWTEDTDV